MTIDCEALAAKPSVASPYDLLFQALVLIPISHYFFLALFTSLAFLYSFLEIHFLHHLRTLFRGDPVTLTYNASSNLCQSLVSNCTILRGRYSATPWLSSPHLQTAFLSLFGKAPPVTYRRQLFLALDGGTIALDWLTYSDVAEVSCLIDNSAAVKHDKTPIVVVIPGLTSDSSSAYVKHLAFNMAKNGWNVVVSNHRGLGGVSLTSDCFYNAGWIYGKSLTIFIVNILKLLYLLLELALAPIFWTEFHFQVKYLGEDKTNTHLVGAAAICSPWDLLSNKSDLGRACEFKKKKNTMCDRFINRRPAQKIYDRVLTLGLQGYAQLHKSILSRLADWEHIEKSSSVREFDNHATRVLGKFETVDTFYRRSSSINHVEHVSVPLLCISALDDPECVQVKLFHGTNAGEGTLTAEPLYFMALFEAKPWWIRAVHEFFGVLSTNPFIKGRRKGAVQCSVDEGVDVNVMGDGSVAATADTLSEASPSPSPNENEQSSNVAVQGRIDKLSRRSRQSTWLLAYIAIITTWPFLVSLLSLLKRRFKTFTLFRK
ncbi:hypothetical protein V6N12_009975 [Hibiscus sabdariffa]|uniref:Uncharacterized protein n=1 Tax=Hibiscus sabdariffa TaxID=183260 RepID=A0ABR2ECC6_9ROSI